MSFRIIGIGEVLWDLLPDGPQMGGAPAKRLSKNNFGVLWCGRPGCTEQAGRLHHKLFLDNH
jgi:hypothetical protein